MSATTDFKRGDRIKKLFPYSQNEYSKYGANKNDIPIGTIGAVRNIENDSLDENGQIKVLFENGLSVDVHPNEIVYQKVLKKGDKVVKYRPYSADIYCKHGGDETKVPLGTIGIVHSVCSSQEYLSYNVDFPTINICWAVSNSEIRLIDEEEIENKDIKQDFGSPCGGILDFLNKK